MSEYDRLSHLKRSLSTAAPQTILTTQGMTWLV